MNRKRRSQSFSGFGLVRTKTYVANKKPKIAFEKIKEIYGNDLERIRSKKGITEKKIQFSKEESEKIKKSVLFKSNYHFIYCYNINHFKLLYFILDTSYNYEMEMIQLACN